MSASKARRLAFTLLAMSWLASPRSASAEVIPSKAEENPAAQRRADVLKVEGILAREEVAAALAARGLGAEQVQQRLTELSAEDLRALASNLDQIQAAGDVPKYIWVLLAIFLAVSILAAVF